jgi:hypothetical protein
MKQNEMSMFYLLNLVLHSDKIDSSNGSYPAAIKIKNVIVDEKQLHFFRDFFKTKSINKGLDYIQFEVIA